MIVGVVSPKGGPGKTTTALNLAGSLRSEDFTTALVDADDENKHSLKWSDYRQQSSMAKDIPVFAAPKPQQLVKTVDELNLKFDAVVIDGRPSTEAITTAIIQVSDILVIPVVPGTLDMWSIFDFIEYYESACKTSKKGYIPGCFLINRFEGNSNFVKEIKGILKDFSEKYPLKLLEATMRKRDDYSKAFTYGWSIMDVDAQIRDENKKLVFPRLEQAQHEWSSVYAEIMQIVHGVHAQTEEQ